MISGQAALSRLHHKGDRSKDPGVVRVLRAQQRHDAVLRVAERVPVDVGLDAGEETVGWASGPPARTTTSGSYAWIAVTIVAPRSRQKSARVLAASGRRLSMPSMSAWKVMPRQSWAKAR